jgi:toxin ParE1/3/4
MRLHLSRLALQDLAAIYDFTVGAWGKDQATKYVSQLWDSLEEIREAPERWRLRPDIYPNCRARACERHLIIYRSHGGAVQISRILHGAMNIQEHIPPLFMPEGEDAGL